MDMEKKLEIEKLYDEIKDLKFAKEVLNDLIDRKIKELETVINDLRGEGEEDAWMVSFFGSIKAECQSCGKYVHRLINNLCMKCFKNKESG